MPHPRRRIQSVVATVLGLRMEVVVVYRGRVRAPREARVVFWEGVRSGLGWQEAAVAAGFPRGGALWFRAAGGVKGNGAGPVSGRYLSLAEREEIAVGLAAGDGVRVIAARLGRAPSTVSREVRRNCLSRGRYRAVAAQRRAEDRARRPKRAKLAGDGELREYVQGRLRKRWSPEEISARLKLEFPDRPEMRVSHETIYQSLYVQGRGALRRELAASLRTGRALRKPRRKDGERRGRIKDMVMISERPAEAADRAVPGHWEGDLLIGARGTSAIGTLVERSTRYALLGALPDGRTSAQVIPVLTALIGRLPDQLRRSLTWDCGAEMSRHAAFRAAAHCPVYFCDPHAPWQRGSNENTNRLLRDYFPRSATNFNKISQADLDGVANELNTRPRHTL